MEYGYLNNDVTAIRTKRLTNILWVTIIVVLSITQLNATHIDFDDVEESWLKNVAVQMLPVSVSPLQQKQLMLKVSGLAIADIEDGVRIKATFSPTFCNSNEPNLQIINDASLKMNTNRTVDLIVSLANFDFKRNAVAYLCIKTSDPYFQHMGPKSQFSK